MNTIYLFRDDFLKSGVITYVCIGDRSVIDRFFREKEVAFLYKREICYVSEVENKDFLGVYGRRQGSKFCSELRNRGCQFVLEKEVPSNLKLKYHLTLFPPYPQGGGN